jgi:cation:H+ antiporter
MLEALVQTSFAYPAFILLNSGISPGLLQDILMMAGILIVFGAAAEFITKGTEKVETLLGQGMAGGLILGFMSALPETIFVIIASTSGYYTVAIATALGGNVLLFTLGIGLIAVSYFSKWKKDIMLKEDYHVDIAFLVISTFALLMLLVYGKLDVISGSLLLLIYVAYAAYRLMQARTRIVFHMRAKESRKILIEGFLFMLVGVSIIALLSRYFISDIIAVAGILAIPAIFLALVITPIAADLEELISAYKLARGTSGGGSTAIVSFIGGKLENNTVLVGIIGLLATAPVLMGPVASLFIAVIIINAAAIAVLSRGKFTYIQGILFIALYFAVMIAVFTL